MTDLAQSCADLRHWLPVAMVLVHRPDQDGTTTGGQPGTRPPWNPSAAAAAMDAHELVRRLEASLRLAVTGRTGPRRGGSDANTMAAITAIENLGHGVTADVMTVAAHVLDGSSTAIQQLAAVDKLERSQRVAAICPYCGFGMLRLSPRAGRVTCLRFGVCSDGDGKHPVGFVQQGLDGEPMVAWADGLVQYGTGGETP
jgi:hypothetical protein